MSQATASRTTNGRTAERLHIPAAAYGPPEVGVVVVFATPTTFPERQCLSRQLGCTVMDIRHALAAADMVLTPELSEGAFSVLKGMFPNASIVVCGLSEAHQIIGSVVVAEPALAAGLMEFCRSSTPRDFIESVMRRISTAQPHLSNPKGKRLSRSHSPQGLTSWTGLPWEGSSGPGPALG